MTEIEKPSKQRLALNSLNQAWRSDLEVSERSKLIGFMFLAYVAVCPRAGLDLYKVTNGHGYIQGFISRSVSDQESRELYEWGFNVYVLRYMRSRWSDQARNFFWDYLDILAWECVALQKDVISPLSLPKEAWTAIAKQVAEMTSDTFDA